MRNKNMLLVIAMVGLVGLADMQELHGAHEKEDIGAKMWRTYNMEWNERQHSLAQDAREKRLAAEQRDKETHQRVFLGVLAQIRAPRMRV